ncbi:MAG: RDD family protein [Acidimicrobiales bacterium]|nr:RDD family protein [Acidimicrobiales bacterium]
MATTFDPDPTKVIGRRVVAALIDGAIVFGLPIGVASSEIEYLELEEGQDGDEFCDEYIDRFDGVCIAVDDTAYFSEASATPTLVLVGLALAIYVILQGLTGWTIGKLLTGIRTVREDGGRPGIGKALVRWLFWIVDGLPFLGLVAFITSLTTVGHRRVGDMVAKTFVVRAAAAGSPIGVGVVSGTAAEAAAMAPPAPTAKAGPQWDAARGTYIQWDPEESAWMRWDEGGKVWKPIATAEPEPEPEERSIPDPPPPPPPPR